jgi:hypothetical protein
MPEAEGVEPFAVHASLERARGPRAATTPSWACRLCALEDWG